jgi:hypothetical protein
MLGGFQPTSAGGSCPPPAGVVNNAQNATTQGLVRQPTPGIGELRCYTPNAVGAINGPEYDWTAQISGSSVLLSASAGQNVNTFAMLNYWWNGGHPDGLQYETTTGR